MIIMKTLPQKMSKLDHSGRSVISRIFVLHVVVWFGIIPREYVTYFECTFVTCKKDWRLNRHRYLLIVGMVHLQSTHMYVDPHVGATCGSIVCDYIPCIAS